VAIARAHEQLLASRGTLILTGVDSSVEKRLRLAAASPLLLVPATLTEIA
jgi:hypothetical protein